MPIAQRAVQRACSHALSCLVHRGPQTTRWGTLHRSPSRATSLVAGGFSVPAGAHHRGHATVRLRPYQEESIQSVLDYLAQGENRLGISLATGAGKTVIFSHLIERVEARSPTASQTLILAHRRELVEQAARHCRSLYPQKVIEIEMGPLKASGSADITVASVKSIVSGNRLSRYDVNRFKLILVDEAHHIVAPTYLAVLQHFGLLERSPQAERPPVLVGVSATFSRSDGLRLGTAIDHIVYHKDYIEMIDQKWLSDVTFTTVHSMADLSKVRSVRGDFQSASLSKAVNTFATNEITVRSWLELGRQRLSTIVFCVDVAHVTSLTDTFRRYGVDAHYVTGSTSARTRSERLKAFKAGKIPVLLNCGIFTEGTDIPNIDCVLLTRPTRSRNLLIQMIGRGLRRFEGKQNCHVIDMVANLDKGIVTIPTLFGLDARTLVQEADASKMSSLRQHRKAKHAKQQTARDNITSSILPSDDDANSTLTHYKDVNSLIASISGERHVRSLSPFAWVPVSSGRYILSDISGSFLTVRVDDKDGAKGITGYSVVCTRRVPSAIKENVKARSPFMRPSIIVTAPSLEAALQAADTYAKNKFTPSWLLTRASWRHAPASATQVDFLNRFRKEGEKLALGDVTKGKAADWITKLKHGARGDMTKVRSAERRTEKEMMLQHQWEAAQKRAQVRVGPVES